MTTKVGASFYPYPDSQSGDKRVPLSKEEFEIFKTNFSERLGDAIAPLLPELNQAFKGLAEAKRMGEAGRKEAEEGRKEAEAGRRKAEEGRAMQAAASQKLALAEKGLQEVAKERQNILTKQFYSIFNGKKELPVDEIVALFNTYLADGSLTVEKNAEGKSYPKINSMRAVTHYLTDHPNVKICDFRLFKDKGAINEIPIFAEFLKKSTVKLVGFKSSISEDDIASLDKAKTARNGELKVQISA
jgi:hypothetical protein